MNETKKLSLLLKSVTILYVEDELAIQKLNGETLSYFTDNLLLANDGEDALEQYHKYKPHLIITDINMPKLNGIKFVEEVRKIDKRIPIIFSTGYSQECYLLPAANLNIQGYVVKPLNYSKLKNILFDIVEYLDINSLIEIKINNTLKYDTNKGAIILDNNDQIQLNNKEKALMELLLEHKQRVVKYQEIETYVWGIDDEYMSETALRTLIKNLRKKLPTGIIENVARQGYKVIVDNN